MSLAPSFRYALFEGYSKAYFNDYREEFTGPRTTKYIDKCNTRPGAEIWNRLWRAVNDRVGIKDFSKMGTLEYKMVRTHAHTYNTNTHTHTHTNTHTHMYLTRK